MLNTCTVLPFWKTIRERIQRYVRGQMYAYVLFVTVNPNCILGGGADLPGGFIIQNKNKIKSIHSNITKITG